MPDHLDPAAFAAELIRDDMRPVLRAFLNLQLGRIRAVHVLREYGCTKATQLDVLVHLYVLVWTLNGGTRQSSLVDALGMSRRTIRGVLERLETCELILRDADGVYYATAKSGEMIAATSAPTLRDIGRLADAWSRIQG